MREAVSDILAEYEFLDAEDRYRLLIDLGRKLEPMPDALKTEATKVRGCSAAVWVYPTTSEDGRLHFLADSNAAITKGIVALVLSTVQDRPAGEVAQTDIDAALVDIQRILLRGLVILADEHPERAVDSEAIGLRVERRQPLLRVEPANLP